MVGDITLHCTGFISDGVWRQEVIRLLDGLAFVAFILLLPFFRSSEAFGILDSIS
jgi:hypothetical protein